MLNGTTLAELTLPLTANRPGIFQHADGSAAALNQDGTINSPTNPAKSGTAVAIWGTGVTELTFTPSYPLGTVVVGLYTEALHCFFV
jgi:uncharacterized protein (TIGR03437 family)